MPNRILKESICTSENIDGLTEFQEIFFYRLIVNCDDFGRMDARPKLLASRLFPLKEVSEQKVSETLSALVNAALISLYTVDGKQYIQVITWEDHQQVRAKKSKYPSPDITTTTFDSTCNQMISDDNKCPRNPIQSESESVSESESEPLITCAEANAIRLEQDKVLDAAIDAGFMHSNTINARLIALYAEHGLDKMIYAISECARHGAPNLAYLEAVLKGGPKKKKAQVNAQDFEQRDYSGVNDDMMTNLAAEVAAFHRQEANG